MLKKVKHHQISVSSALWLLRLGNFFFETMSLLIPVIVLLYTQKGITVGDFFLIQGLYRLSVFLFEMPSGYLSDRYSRRKVLIFGALVHLIGFILLVFAHNFIGLVLVESCWGVANALFSGTMEAYTYDLLKRDKKQKDFLKEYGSIQTFGLISAFITTLLGGLLYETIGGNAMIWILALFGFMQTITYIAIPELTEIKRKKQKNRTAFSDAINITCTTLKNQKLRNFILFPSFFSGFTIIILWINQPIMEQATIPVAMFGIFYSIDKFVSIFFSKYAYKICEKLGEAHTSMLTILSLILGILAPLVMLNTTNTILIYSSCFILSVVPSLRMLNSLQYNTLIHHAISSQKRGTVLSTKMMVQSIFGAMMLGLAKVLLDNFGIQTTMIFTLLMTVLLFWSLNKVKKDI